MVNRKLYRDLGKRNKGLFWEYESAYGFIHTKMPKTKYNIPLFLGYGSGEGNNHCHNLGVIEDNKKIMIKEFNQGIYTKDFFKEIDNVYRSKFQLIKKICKDDFSKYSNKKLAKTFEVICKYITEGNTPMLMALMTQYLKSFFEKELLKVLKENEKNRKLELMSLLLTSPRLTQVQIEEELLLKFEESYHNKIKEDSKKEFLKFVKKNIKKLNELTDKAGWFHMEYIKDPWTIEDYKEHIWKRIQNKTYENSKFPRERIKEIMENQISFFKKHPDSKKLKNLAFALQEFSFILDASKAVIVEGRYRALPLFDEVARRLDLSRKDLLQLAVPETIALLCSGKKVDKNLIKERWKARAVLQKNGKILIYQSKEAVKIAEKLIEKQVIIKDEARGIVGYPGKVKGKVTVIHSIEDSHKFKEGDILVSHDVSAELTSYLKKAAAIVTDQGGIICHAAIVAREFKTPCIVGTKTASKIFKDGDYVEVDAEKGIVRKIK